MESVSMESDSMSPLQSTSRTNLPMIAGKQSESEVLQTFPRPSSHESRTSPGVRGSVSASLELPNTDVDKPVIPVQTYAEKVKQLAPKLIDVIMKNLRDSRSKIPEAKGMDNITEIPTVESAEEQTHKFLSNLKECLNEVIPEIGHANNLEPILHVDLSLFFLSVATDATTLITLHTLLLEAKKVLALKKGAINNMAEGASKEEALKDINLLQEWINKNTKIYNSTVKSCGIGTALKLPRISYDLLAIINVSAKGLEILSPIVLFFSTLSEGYKLYKEKKNLSILQTWKETFKSHDSEKTLEKLESNFALRCEKNLPVVKKFVEKLIKDLDTPENFDGVKKKLKDLHVDFPDDATVAGLKEILGNDKEISKINAQMVRTQEEVSVVLRNTCKLIANKKAKIEKKFSLFEINKIRATLTTTVLATALVITFKVLLAFGVGGALLGLAGTGFGLIGVLGVAALVGLAYFIYKKPNTFRSLFTKAQLTVIVNQFPLFLSKIRIYKTQLKIAQLSSELMNRSDTDDVRIRTLQNQLNSLNGKANDLERKIREAKVELAEAGWKDYKRLSGIMTEEKDIPETLAEWLLKDETILDDPETARILKSLDIDLEKIRKMENAEKELADSIKLFFGSKDFELIDFLQNEWDKKLGEDGYQPST